MILSYLWRRKINESIIFPKLQWIRAGSLEGISNSWIFQSKVDYDGWFIGDFDFWILSFTWGSTLLVLRNLPPFRKLRMEGDILVKLLTPTSPQKVAEEGKISLIFQGKFRICHVMVPVDLFKVLFSFLPWQFTKKKTYLWNRFDILFPIKLFPGSLFWGICFLFGILIWGTTNKSMFPAILKVRQIITSSGFALECLRIVVASATLDSFYKNAVKVGKCWDEGMNQ